MYKTTSLHTLPIVTFSSDSDYASLVSHEIFAAYGIKSASTQAGMVQAFVEELQTCPYILPGSPQIKTRFDLIFLSPISDEAKKALFSLSACIMHEHRSKYTSTPAWTNGARMDQLDTNNYYVLNWNHTVEELLHITSYAHQMNEAVSGSFSSKDIETALLASVLTDSKKGPEFKEIFVHHLNSGEFFRKNLYQHFRGKDLNPNGIYKAILAHQFNPPFVMNFVAKGLLPADATTPQPVKESLLAKIGNPYRNITTIPKTVNGIPGHHGVELSTAELAALKKIHPEFKGWFYPGADDKASWLVVLGDGMQYPGSALSKIIQVRGPGTNFKDPTIKAGIGSILGKGDFSSVGTTEVLFTHPAGKEFYTLQIDCAEKLAYQTLAELPRFLMEQPGFTEFINTLPQPHKDNALKGEIPFLNLDFPYDKLTTPPNEETKAFLDLSKWVKTGFSTLFFIKHFEAMANGSYFDPHLSAKLERKNSSIDFTSAFVAAEMSPSTTPRGSQLSLLPPHKILS